MSLLIDVATWEEFVHNMLQASTGYGFTLEALSDIKGVFALKFYFPETNLIGLTGYFRIQSGGTQPDYPTRNGVLVPTLRVYEVINNQYELLTDGVTLCSGFGVNRRFICRVLPGVIVGYPGLNQSAFSIGKIPVIYIGGETTVLDPAGVYTIQTEPSKLVTEYLYQAVGVHKTVNYPLYTWNHPMDLPMQQYIGLDSDILVCVDAAGVYLRSGGCK